MFNIILFEPEIPPNTGNIIRLCANTGASLHLIHPLGFDLDAKKLRRAGLDYHEFAEITQHNCLEDCLEHFSGNTIYALTTKAVSPYSSANFKPGDAFIFGPETRGLPDKFLNVLKESNKLKLPMQKDSRSLNLSNTVAVILYEAWRQNNFTIEGQ
jgi:tRNA (cytidine/uridine-2'-O-)-methyltransferase